MVANHIRLGRGRVQVDDRDIGRIVGRGGCNIRDLQAGAAAGLQERLWGETGCGEACYGESWSFVGFVERAYGVG